MTLRVSLSHSLLFDVKITNIKRGTTSDVVKTDTASDVITFLGGFGSVREIILN